ncbi:MAG: efflux RND transporter permease subunit, partial [Candidatus Margulisiibacteriota bacterium]
ILTTIIAFSPMFFMSGIMGKFIFQIPLVITCALLISLIEVVVALPSHLAAQKKTAKKEFKLRHKLILKLRQSYERILLKFLKNKYRVVLGFVLFFFGTIFYAGAFMNFVLFPESSAVRFYVRTEAPAGTSLQETAKRLLPIEKEIMKLPNNELLAFTTRVGMTGDSYFLAEQENLGIIMVDLIPFSGRDRSAREIMEEIKLKTENTKGFNRITYQVDAGGPPVGKAINIRVITDNNDLRTNVANQVYKFVSSLDGVVSTDRDDKKQKKQMEIKLNKKAISQLGLNIATIQQVIRTGYSGFYASSIRLGDEDIFFNIEMSEQNKSSLSVLRNLAIPNQQGRLIRLKSIAKIRMVPGSPNFNHYNGKRSVSITGDINSKIITSTQVTKIVSKKFNSSTFPNVQFEFGGESEETNKSVQDLIRSFVLAVIGIFFLLILLFNSLSQPFIVLLTIPFGLIGVIIAFAIHGQDLGFISMVGAVGLTGVVVNDSLVLVNHLNQKKTSIKTKKELIPEIIQGSGDRFRPIMITSCSTVAGLLPLAYGLGGADPFIAPMALAIGYGLLFSTPLTLFLLPALFLIQIELVEVYVKLRKKIKRFRIFKKLKLKF